MKDKMVSIIIPVFNSEKYLERCIDSAIKQTYENIEIIIVDDCSKDKSKEIIEQYEIKNKKIKKILLSKNQGVSNARNVGMSVSDGEYIVFLDSDDYIDPFYIETLINNKEDEDMLVVVANNVKTEIYDSKSYALEVAYGKFFGSCWGYLIDKNKITCKFDLKTTYMEDTIFIMNVILNYKKVKVINCSLYNYIENEDSLTKKKDVNSLKRIYGYTYSIDKIKELLENQKMNFNQLLLNNKKIDLCLNEIYSIDSSKVLKQFLNCDDIRNILALPCENRKLKCKLLKSKICYQVLCIRLYIKKIYYKLKK